jgi:hypothetical protein
LTVEQYERIRAYPRRFLIAHGHEVEAEDGLFYPAAGWVVVEVGEVGPRCWRSDRSARLNLRRLR